MGAVRTSRKDKWEPRPAVQRYYAWRDALRAYLGVTRATPWTDCDEVIIVAHFKTKAQTLWGLPHKEKPDIDNIYKAVTDALFPEDCGIWHDDTRKLWGPENVLELTFVGLRR